jgi:hypothetical protein
VKSVVPPTAFGLHQNYPNPFNPSTTIRFDLPEESLVRVSVYDMLGRRVETLVDEARQSGTHSVKWTPKELSSGVYQCVIEAAPLRGGGTLRDSRRMIFLK